jgi:hypothetical protein
MLTKDFVLAGRAIFTVDNGRGEWYTFQVKHKPADAQWPAKWFLSLLTGPANTTDYTYVGLLRLDGTIGLTAKSRYNDESLPVKVARWALKLIWSESAPPAGYQIRHEGACGRCGRPLTTPESLERGLGPICDGRSLAAV